MYKVKSTYKVLAYKVLHRDSREEWIDWALEMMTAGFESEYLFILAGLSSNINGFEFDDVVNKTLKELALDNATEDEIVSGYVYWLITEALEARTTKKEVLRELRDLCRYRDYDNQLFSFYLLYYAVDELEEQGHQFYWENLDSNNIESEVLKEFVKWKNDYEIKARNRP